MGAIAELGVLLKGRALPCSKVKCRAQIETEIYSGSWGNFNIFIMPIFLNPEGTTKSLEKEY